jgi:hypothetical protein
MTSDNERARDAEPAGEGNEAAESRRRRPRTRVFAEAVVAAIPEEGEAVAAAPSDTPRKRRTRVVSEAVVAAIPAGGDAAEGGADDEAGAGA